MRWPWGPRPDTAAADRAVTEAEVHLYEAQAIRPEVARVAGSLRSLRERNHFAASIDALWRAARGEQ